MVFSLFVFYWSYWDDSFHPSRYLTKDKSSEVKKDKKRIAIYGAGAAGAQLLASLRLSGTTKIFFF